MPDRLLALALGGIRLDVAMPRSEPALFRLAETLFEGYTVAPAEDACRLQVVPFSHSRCYRWKPAELQACRQLFASTYRRFPPVARLEQAVAETVDILRSCDPAAPAVRQLRRCFKLPAKVMCATASSDLFFYDPQTATATLLLRRRARRKQMLPGVVNGVMWAVGYLLLQHDGLLLHGCAIRKNGRSMLFLGRSGDGKTTAARLLRPDVCFSDDGVIVRKTAGRFRVYPSPFRQFEAAADPAGAPGEIVNIYLLEKSARTQVVPLAKSALMHMVLAELIHFFKFVDRESAEKGFETVRDLVASVPVHRLRFAKSGNLWDNMGVN